MSGDLFPAVLLRREDITPEVTLFEFGPELGRTLPSFTAGSHIRVEVADGLIRSYSLNNDEAEKNRYIIAVKREENGRGGSLGMHRNLRPGARVHISSPQNFMPVVPAERYLLIAGGIGITPIISILRKLQREGHTNWHLIYLVRNHSQAAYLSELMSEELRDRVTIHASDDAGYFDFWPYVQKQAVAHLYYCGPKSMMDALYALTIHWPRSHIHYEEFSGGTLSKAGNLPFRVRRAGSDEVIEIPAEESVVEVFRRLGYKPKSSCETGTCRTCIVGLIAGEADHRDLCLSTAERSHCFAPCVSRALGEELTLEI